jgi:hypothetical protein
MFPAREEETEMDGNDFATAAALLRGRVLPTMIPIFSISPFLPSGAVSKSICVAAKLRDHILDCSLRYLTSACWLSFSAASSPSFLSDL